MRRGLIARSLVELPDAVFDARLDRLRAAMQAAELDALVIYTNNTRPAGVSWLTGFVPYWSEAVLVVPREGGPYLVAALSFRVKPWIERVSRLADVLHTPRIGLKAAQQIAATQADAAVGIVDFDGLPAGIAEDLREGGPKLTLHDASALFTALRGVADPAEIALATKAAAIGRHALAAAEGDNLNAMIAAVESEARQLGAEEIYVAAAPDLERDTRFRRIEGEAALGKSFRIARHGGLQGNVDSSRPLRVRSRDRAGGSGALCASRCVVAERSRICRLSLLAGRRLPHGAAARSADRIAPRRRISAAAGRAGFGAGGACS